MNGLVAPIRVPWTPRPAPSRAARAGGSRHGRRASRRSWGRSVSSTVVRDLRVRPYFWPRHRTHIPLAVSRARAPALSTMTPREATFENTPRRVARRRPRARPGGRRARPTPTGASAPLDTRLRRTNADAGDVRVVEVFPTARSNTSRSTYVNTVSFRVPLRRGRRGRRDGRISRDPPRENARTSRTSRELPLLRSAPPVFLGEFSVGGFARVGCGAVWPGPDRAVAIPRLDESPHPPSESYQLFYRRLLAERPVRGICRCASSASGTFPGVEARCLRARRAL